MRRPETGRNFWRFLGFDSLGQIFETPKASDLTEADICEVKERSMPAIVIVLSFLVLFLIAFLVVLLGPFVGLGFAFWKSNKLQGNPSRAQENAARV
jgi:hypothetical protein